MDDDHANFAIKQNVGDGQYAQNINSRMSRNFERKKSKQFCLILLIYNLLNEFNSQA